MFPAARAAGPIAENTPAPIIDPRPTITASRVPSLRASREAGGCSPRTPRAAVVWSRLIRSSSWYRDSDARRVALGLERRRNRAHRRTGRPRRSILIATGLEWGDQLAAKPHPQLF